jgi:uncharacterized protein YbjT (DUF2867 family)
MPYDRVQQHAALIYAAAAVGVQRISFINTAADATFILARDYFHTEELIRGTGLNSRFCARTSMHRSRSGALLKRWCCLDD